MFSIRLLLSLSLLMIAGVFSPSNSSAAIVISFGPSTPSPLTVGGLGMTVDVSISSTGSDQLDGSQLRVGLTPTGGSLAGGLIFSSTQLDSQLTDPGYVFAGNSLAVNSSQAVGTVSGSGSVFTGYDATNDLVPVTLTSSKLLYRLNLTAIAAGTYEIGVVTGPTSSFFSDQNEPTITSIPFSWNNATLTVTAVPEPSSVALLSIGVVAMGALRLRRRSLRREV